MHAKLDLTDADARAALADESDVQDEATAGLEQASQDTFSSSMSGSFDGIDGDHVFGWARDELSGDAPVAMDVFADDRWVAGGLADQLRGDLLKAGIGRGKHAFRIALPAELCDGESHEISVRAGASGLVLAPGARTFQQLSSFAGHIDGLEGSFLVGWVGDLSKRRDAIDLELRIDGKPVASGVASMATPEGLRFGLRIPPSSMDGRPHLLAVAVKDPFFLIGEFAAVLPTSLTPADALRRHTSVLSQAALIEGAVSRYEALRRQVDLLANSSELTASDAMARLRQVAAAHEQVIRGFDASEQFAGPPTALEFPQLETPLVSVVIPVHNKVRVTQNCLASLILAPNRASFEVIIVDDGSTDETLELSESAKGVRFVRHDAAQGFVRSCNDGAQIARGAYVLMLNNDTEVTPGWIDELLHVFEHFDGVGMAGAKLVYADGKLQEAGGIVWNNGDPWNYGRAANAAEPRFNYTRQIDYISGACIMLPKRLWDELGGFDEQFAPAYFEDADLAFRVREKGFKTVYTPFSRVTHFEGISSGTSVTSGMKRFQEVNRPKFKARWSRDFKSNGTVGRDVDINKDRNVRFRALMIDCATPQPDRDAGSYAAVQEMRLLQSLGFKVTFLPDNLAYMGSATEALQRAGVECLYSPFLVSARELLESRGPEFDIVYVTRYSIAQRHIEAIRRFAPQAKVIFNNADLHFLRELRAAIASRSSDEMNRALKTREEELSLMRKVDLVLSYNEVEHAVIVSHNLDSTRVARCPWVVEVPEGAGKFEERHGIAFLGGFSHHPNVEAMDFFVREVMPLLRKRLPGVPLRIYGSSMPERVLQLAAEDVLIEGWVNDVAEVYGKCRVFVAPLRSGAGLKGKVISALAHGVPCVLSPVAAEGTGIREGQEAFMAETPADWVEGIARLYDDRALWLQMHAAARKYASSEFSFAKGQALMQRALSAVDVYANPDEQVLCHH
jgi:GT2 family glycosyltransferase